MASFISHNAAETQQYGETWSREAGPGWVIGLRGDLGAGKTQLVKGLAHGLGVPQRIHSPTFTLVHEYPRGRYPLYHLDLYRLQHADEIAAAGLAEYFFREDGITVVEWIDRWQPPLSLQVPPGAHYRDVSLEILDDSRRRIIYEDFSP
ncbi:MAG TPA: tRNA (adenosine(37)-N6)-threonylcarbamoyltransferase complex ATPase subunit type 1 TsaE [Candidatus Paceibacterota bacterium]|nr:tRNA (adenosine(37)-N6)-threonylcarbamoyltransferase complex ATPase subunit type 1 TsaE [Verrucomicrobiota bacterium]HRY51781.1 tRNA (adenosine(37)-N6)-threonylcarbamoyltransferase complex ATPase subunit type 1 TsaE [Candidatus Paceibacterota bacterium]HSA02094.1 tRNA (adenosine(37)-N6)-threonylcarbamoyltransferase complex ATPase subunit type 1 TsaE [Candidatus Paceibacterota bacterium]